MSMLLEKRNLLKKLNDTYCRIMPSKISGVGVFAVRDIPKGINPFKGPPRATWIKFNLSELTKLDSEVQRMIKDFYVVENNGDVFVQSVALNGMDISFFVNDSRKPNLTTRDDGLSFITKRKIAMGEELTVNYRTYDGKG